MGKLKYEITKTEYQNVMHLRKIIKNKANVFLEKLSEEYKDDIILLICDGASWHKSKGLKIAQNVVISNIPPYTPEMNPIEQIWKQLRQMGFKNEIFKTLQDVMDRLCDTINDLTKKMVKSITLRDWIEHIKYYNS